MSSENSLVFSPRVAALLAFEEACGWFVCCAGLYFVEFCFFVFAFGAFLVDDWVDLDVLVDDFDGFGDFACFFECDGPFLFVAAAAFKAFLSWFWQEYAFALWAKHVVTFSSLQLPQQVHKFNEYDFDPAKVGDAEDCFAKCLVWEDVLFKFCALAVVVSFCGVTFACAYDAVDDGVWPVGDGEDKDVSKLCVLRIVEHHDVSFVKPAGKREG